MSNSICVTREGFQASLDIAWDSLKEDKQTLFAVWKEGYDYVPHRGLPPPSFRNGSFFVRTSKSINMHPPWRLEMKGPEGRMYSRDERVIVSLVDANAKQLPKKGTCLSCSGESSLTCKKPPSSQKADSVVETVVKNGLVELSKVQIGCCSGGKRGHGAPFCLKVEFPSADSPFHQHTVYSLPIEVGAKNPFASHRNSLKTVGAKNGTTSGHNAPSMPPALPLPLPLPASPVSPSSPPSPVAFPLSPISMAMTMIGVTQPYSPTLQQNYGINNSAASNTNSNANANSNMNIVSFPTSNTANKFTLPPISASAASNSSFFFPVHSTYDGSAITKLLKQLHLEHYIHLFHEQEIDVCDLLLMKDEDFVQLGIDKAGPRIKLRETIESLKKLCDTRKCLFVPKGFNHNISL